MNIQHIEKWSLRYTFLKLWFGFWHNKIFYKKIVILNSKNIPKDAHLIFTPNHQNALMDALALLFSIKGQPVFLARGDIFNRPFIARILIFMKMLPVYLISLPHLLQPANDFV